MPSAVQIHLVVVHLPVVGVLGVTLLLAIGQVLDHDLLRKLAYAGLIACALCAIAAYYSGPEAYEQLETTLAADKSWVENHAVIARAAFIATLVVAAVAVQALLQYAQDEPPSRWLHILLLLAMIGLCYLFAWSAHLGGLIRHVEARQPHFGIFPGL